MAASCHKHALFSLQMAAIDAEAAGWRCLSDMQINVKGVTNALQPLSLSHEPELKRMLNQIDLD